MSIKQFIFCCCRLSLLSLVSSFCQKLNFKIPVCAIPVYLAHSNYVNLIYVKNKM